MRAFFAQFTFLPVKIIRIQTIYGETVKKIRFYAGLFRSFYVLTCQDNLEFKQFMVKP